jgi:hypothetical protein
VTKAERAHMEAVQALGCIVCRTTHEGYVPAEIHHVLKNGRRMGHMFVLPLCWQHHRLGANTPSVVSRHPWRLEFQARYGTEEQLLAKVDELLSRSGHITPDVALQS